MNLSKSFTLNELTKSQEATRLGIDNTPSDEYILNLKILCEQIVQHNRDFYLDSFFNLYKTSIKCF